MMRANPTWATVLASMLIVSSGCGLDRSRSRPEAPPQIRAPSTPRLLDFEATAYSIEGTTASGERARRGIVAADPAILPLGSRIRIHDAGRYSGEYLVGDTGRTIKGREVDVHLESARDAKRFGRRRVKVEVLSRGDEPARSR